MMDCTWRLVLIEPDAYIDRARFVLFFEKNPSWWRWMYDAWDRGIRDFGSFPRVKGDLGRL